MKNLLSGDVVICSAPKRIKLGSSESYYFFLHRLYETQESRLSQTERTDLWNLILVSKNKKAADKYNQTDEDKVTSHKVQISECKDVWVFFRRDPSNYAGLCFWHFVKEGENAERVWNTHLKEERDKLLQEVGDYADEDDVEGIIDHAKTTDLEKYFKFLDYHFALYRVNLTTDLDKDGLTSVYEF